jgi:hypothetical protein
MGSSKGHYTNEKLVSFHSNVLYHVLLLLVNVQGLSVITSNPPMFLFRIKIPLEFSSGLKSWRK